MATQAPSWYSDVGGCQHGEWKWSISTPWVIQCKTCGELFYIMRIPIITKLRKLLERLIAEKEDGNKPPLAA